MIIKHKITRSASAKDIEVSRDTDASVVVLTISPEAVFLTEDEAMELVTALSNSFNWKVSAK